MKRMTLRRLGRAGFVVCALGASATAEAQETIKLADDRHVPAQGQTEFRFDLAAVPAGKQVRLGLDARIEWGGLGGSTPAMSAYINDQGLAGRHLVNKPLVYSMRHDVELAWGSENGCGYRLMYSPDFSDRIKTDESYEYGIAGVVIGEERILTNRSGRFGWGDGSSAEAHVFDGEGRRVVNPNLRELRRGKTILTELRMPANHLAVLVRKRG